MKKLLIIFALFAFVYIMSIDECRAVYFTIELNNGNEIKTANYQDRKDSIFFYTAGGSVTIPKNIIKKIAKHEGELGSQKVYYSSEIQEEFDLGDEPAEAPVPEQLPESEQQKQKLIEDLKDRINIIETNIVNLTKNKQTYINRREQVVKDREKSERLLEEFKNDNYTSNEYLEERIEREKNKIKDAEMKLLRIDEQIENTENNLEIQKRRKERLQNQISEVKQS